MMGTIKNNLKPLNMGSTADHEDEYKVKPNETWQQFRDRTHEPPPPCPITEQVVKDLKTRSALGLMKYGVTLGRKDLTLRDWLQHAYEECLDQAKYLKRAISELDQNNA
jgi:hypothetical protein